jgi:WD40 repeat protein
MLFDTNERLLILGANASGKAAVFVTAPSDTGQPPVPARIRLGAVDLESGKVAELGAIENSFFYNIHISPDGRSLAYVTWDDGTSVIKLRNLESGVEKILLTEKDRKVLISSLEWSPDGTKIVFGRQSRSNLLSMFVE